MPRGRVSPSVSNLSVLIPKDVHRRVRLSAIQSNGQSMGAVIAWWLDKIPESVSPSELVEIYVYELRISTLMTRKSGE